MDFKAMIQAEIDRKKRKLEPKEKHCRQLFILQENAFDDKSDPVVYFDIKVEYKPNSSINL
jgi:hypothetical protein